MGISCQIPSGLTPASFRKRPCCGRRPGGVAAARKDGGWGGCFGLRGVGMLALRAQSYAVSNLWVWGPGLRRRTTASRKHEGLHTRYRRTLSAAPAERNLSSSNPESPTMTLPSHTKDSEPRPEAMRPAAPYFKPNKS